MIYFYIAATFLIGAIPFGYIVAKLFKGIDIREHGSGNPGATNVFRVLGPLAGITAFILDFLKGFLPVYLAIVYFSAQSQIFLLAVGIAAVFGHVFTPFLGFKGGKGVATGTGVFFALLPFITFLAVIVFAVTFITTRYVSMSSIVSGIFAAVLAWVFNEPLSISIFATVIALFIIYTHRSNIKRLVNGTENRFKNKKESN